MTARSAFEDQNRTKQGAVRRARADAGFHEITHQEFLDDKCGVEISRARLVNWVKPAYSTSIQPSLLKPTYNKFNDLQVETVRRQSRSLRQRPQSPSLHSNFAPNTPDIPGVSAGTFSLRRFGSPNQAAVSRPVSVSQFARSVFGGFPDRLRFTGNFGNIRVFWANLDQKPHANSMACEVNSLSDRTGN